MADRSLSGRVAVVTGAGRGIGAACALALDEAGARVVLVSRTEAELLEVAGTLANDPIVLTADLSVPGAAGRLAEEITARVDPVHVLVNSAGMAMRRAPDELSEADVDAVLDLNVRALLMLTVGLAAPLRRSGAGSVVNIGSVAGERGVHSRAAYSASKGAVDGLTRSLALDWARAGIRVNTVAPGMIDSPIWASAFEANPEIREQYGDRVPAGRWGTPRDVADAVVFLASDAARYVTGETLTVDGGLAMAAQVFAPRATSAVGGGAAS